MVSGSGVLRDALESEAKSLKLRAHFIGWQPDPLQVLAGYDLLLMPSLWEGFGLVLLEAMAQGRPIVASRVSAIPEVVQHNETGLLVPPRDVNALADALGHLLSDADTRRQFGEAAKQRLETVFHVDKMAKDTVSLYSLIL